MSDFEKYSEMLNDVCLADMTLEEGNKCDSIILVFTGSYRCIFINDAIYCSKWNGFSANLQNYIAPV